jgi:predicted ATPase
LLAAPEQKLFRSLSVFTGSFTTEAAREVAFSDLQATESCTILDELTQLV